MQFNILNELLLNWDLINNNKEFQIYKDYLHWDFRKKLILKVIKLNKN